MKSGDVPGSRCSLETAPVLPPLLEIGDNLLRIRYNERAFATTGSKNMSVSDYEHLAIAAEDLSSFAENPFDFQYPPRLIFGQDSLDLLGELMLECGGRRALLVSDPGVAAAGHASRAVASLEAAGIEVFFFEEIDENPTTRHVENLTTFARSNRVDCIVGVGGGSAIDAAKGANFLITNGGRMEDYWGYGKAPEPMLPMLAVPTPAGTGPETPSCALTGHEVPNPNRACRATSAMAYQSSSS